jgi:hypothetical protein
MLPDIDKNKPEKQPIVKMAGYLEKKGRMVSIKLIIIVLKY